MAVDHCKHKIDIFFETKTPWQPRPFLLRSVYPVKWKIRLLPKLQGERRVARSLEYGYIVKAGHETNFDNAVSEIRTYLGSCTPWSKYDVGENAGFTYSPRLYPSFTITWRLPGCEDQIDYLTGSVIDFFKMVKNTRWVQDDMFYYIPESEDFRLWLY